MSELNFVGDQERRPEDDLLSEHLQGDVLVEIF